MYITAKLKLDITNTDIISLSNNFIEETNKIIDVFYKNNHIIPIKYNQIKNIPWNSKGKCLAEAKKVFLTSKYKTKIKKKYCIWGKENFYLKNSFIYYESLGKKYNKIKFSCDKYNNNLILNQLIEMRIFKKNGKWYSHITVLVSENKPICSNNVLAIDIGLFIPAVSYSSNSEVNFFSLPNNRLKRLNMYQNNNKKIKNYLTNFDHQISKQIIDYSVKHNISTIVLENFNNYNHKIKSSPVLNKWSYKRLQYFVEYKAKLKGINIKYVNPSYTSMKCPLCGKINHPKKRQYICRYCGYENHRDIVGAINILSLYKSS